MNTPSTPSELTPIQPLCREITKAVRAHEHADHNGERCCEERASAVASLIHCLMLQPEELKQVIILAITYLTEHHHRKGGNEQ